MEARGTQALQDPGREHRRAGSGRSRARRRACGSEPGLEGSAAGRKAQVAAARSGAGRQRRERRRGRRARAGGRSGRARPGGNFRRHRDRGRNHCQRKAVRGKPGRSGRDRSHGDHGGWPALQLRAPRLRGGAGQPHGDGARRPRCDQVRRPKHGPRIHEGAAERPDDEQRDSGRAQKEGQDHARGDGAGRILPGHPGCQRRELP